MGVEAPITRKTSTATTLKSNGTWSGSGWGGGGRSGSGGGRGSGGGGGGGPRPTTKVYELHDMSIAELPETTAPLRMPVWSRTG